VNELKNSTFTHEVNILVVDDHPFIHEGLEATLSIHEDLFICGEARTAREALSLIEKHKPDVIISDISLGNKSGLELIRDLKQLYPQLPVVVLSMHDETVYGLRALQAGAKGYVMKREKTSKLVEAIRQVLAGHIYVSHQLSTHLVSELSRSKGKASNQTGINLLTDREFEIFQLIGSGKKTSEIANALSISIKTVNAHRSNIREKLSYDSFNDLLVNAVRWIESAA